MTSNAFRKLLNYVDDVRARQRISIALARGHAGQQARLVDLRDPLTWQFGGFSQNGEDGILQVLRSQLGSRNRYFLEIGAADGLQNNSSWLALVENHTGLMIDGDPALGERARRVVVELCVGVRHETMLVNRETAGKVMAMSQRKDPDMFSLDIDSIDYHVAHELFAQGLRPKIVAVEYNSVFGPERACTVPYDAGFLISRHPTQLFYGVSLAAWKRFFAAHGYRFVTVDSHGINAFFVDPSHFPAGFLGDIRPLEFAENVYQNIKFGMGWGGQLELLRDAPILDV